MHAGVLAHTFGRRAALSCPTLVVAVARPGVVRDEGGEGRGKGRGERVGRRRRSRKERKRGRKNGRGKERERGVRGRR